MMSVFGLPPISGFPRSPDVSAHHLFSVAAAEALHRKHIRFHLLSSFKEIYCFDHLYGIKNFWHETALTSSRDTFAETLSGLFTKTSWLCLFSGKDGDKQKSTSGRDSSSGRPWNFFSGRPWNFFCGRPCTNTLLSINVMAYVAQIATQGRLTLWGAKINSLIAKGELWRLVTPCLLHANIVHLMINCYSLNSVAPVVEDAIGPRRFLAVYFTSAIAGSAMSYFFSKAPSVGASGAIFGLVSSYAVFILRHRDLVVDGKRDVLHIANVIALNMIIGLMSKSIDNWGHLGGLLGGAAISWFVGPAWRYERQLGDGRSVFVDRAPICLLFKWK
uniref:RBL protein n=1 Tax=Chimonanthus praecox TaxID=13419 RepID=S5RYD1_9MAGN|nr:RBL protein [Chimonanthus praecox]